LRSRRSGSGLSITASAADDQPREPLALEVLFERAEARSGDVVAGLQI
jgi:hypothetical protein